MITESPKLTAIAIVGLCLAVPSISFSNQASNPHASTSTTWEENGKDIHNGYRVKGRLGNRVRLGDGKLATSSSSYYFNLGVKKFKEEKWDEAEKAFEKVLLTSHLHRQAYYYLAHINSKQGDTEQVVKYVKAFHGFEEAQVSPECLALGASSDIGLVELVESANSGEISQTEFVTRMVKLVESLGPEFARACKLVSKRRSGNVDLRP